MSLVCSILLPTRGRIQKLERCLKSIYASANPSNYEVLLAIDDDDAESRRNFGELERKYENIYAFISPRGNGWRDLHKRYTELATKASAPWIWMFNDDCEILGQGWDMQLVQIPKQGVIVHPEFNHLNASVYSNDATGAFPIVPNGCWKDFGFDAIGDPPDKFLNDVCAQFGWKPSFLKGITVYHERILDETMSTHSF